MVLCQQNTNEASGKLAGSHNGQNGLNIIIAITSWYFCYVGSTSTAAQAADNPSFNVIAFDGVLGGLAAIIIILLAVVVTLQVAVLRRTRLERRKESTQEPNSRLTPEETEATFHIYSANN